MKNTIQKTLNQLKSSVVNNKLFAFLSLFSIIVGLFSFALVNNYSNLLTAFASEPTEPACAGSPTTATWNPFPIITSTNSPMFGPCRDMPMLSFFPVDIENGNPRTQTIRSGGTSSIHFYYNPQGPDNTINNPRANVEIVRSTTNPRQYTIRGSLTGSNVANVNSAAKGGDLTLNIPEGYRLEIDWDSGSWFPKSMHRRWLADTRGITPSDSERGMPSIINRFDDSQEQGAINSGGLNISYKDDNNDGVRDADTPDSLRGGFLNYGYYLFNLILMEDTPEPDPEPEPDPTADLSLTKTVNNTTPAVGDNITYTIRVTNNGPDRATGVTVKDQLPTGISYVSSSGHGTYNSEDGIWTIGNIDNGQTRSLNIVARVDTGASGRIRNIAQVQTADQRDPDSTPGNLEIIDGVPAREDFEDDEDDAIINIREPEPDPTADLSLTKTVNNATPAVGDNITYTIRVTNNGPDRATGVTVKDQLPTGISYVSSSGHGTYNSEDGIWTIGNIDNGQTRSLNIVARVDTGASGRIRNIAQVQTADQRDPDSTPGNLEIIDGVPAREDFEDDEDDAIINIREPEPARPTFSIEKSVNPESGTVVNPNQELTYTIRVTNTSSTNQTTAIRITDLLDTRLTFVSCSNDCQTSERDSTTLVTWQVNNLSAGQSINLTLNVRVKQTATGTIRNIATIRPGTDDNVEPNDGPDYICPPAGCDSNEVTSPLIGSLALEKTVDNQNPSPDSIITYTIRYNNLTGVELTGAVITDRVPDGLTYIADSCRPSDICSFNEANKTLTWNIGTIATGRTGSVTFKARVNSNSTGEINNTAIISTDQKDDVQDSTRINIRRVVITPPRSGGIQTTIILSSFATFSLLIFSFIKKNKLSFKNIQGKRIKEDE